MYIVITGGTGRLGTRLTRRLVEDGHQVVVLSRSPEEKRELVPPGAEIVLWDAATGDGWLEHANAADAIVNFAGEDLAGGSFIPKRWTDERKRRIRQSRRDVGEAVVDAVERAENKPAILLQASASGYYGTDLSSERKPEGTPPGDDFLAKACMEWEASTAPVEDMGVRRIITRTGIVLDRNEGPLPRLLLPVKMFVGGPLGTGDQYYPWIHVEDAVRAYMWLLENENAQGPYNISAPRPVTNRELVKTMGEVMNRPTLIPAPGFALRLALGEVSTLVLEGQRMVPERLEQTEYQYEHPELKPALEDLLG